VRSKASAAEEVMHVAPAPAVPQAAAVVRAEEAVVVAPVQAAVVGVVAVVVVVGDAGKELS
jgi:anaerobic C4-dicarboxylate transporter